MADDRGSPGGRDRATAASNRMVEEDDLRRACVDSERGSRKVVFREEGETRVSLSIKPLPGWAPAAWVGAGRQQAASGAYKALFRPSAFPGD